MTSSVSRHVAAWSSVRVLVITVAGACLLADSAMAQGQGKPGKRRQRQGNRPQMPDQEEMLRRFDVDGNGELSEDEQRQARQTLGQERQMVTWTKLFDRDGDGELSTEEIQAARQEVAKAAQSIEEKMVALHDANGDGRLDEQEVAAFRPQRGKDKKAASAAGAGFPQRAKRMLQPFDRDRDGRISDREFQDVRRTLEQRAQSGNAPFVTEMFRKFDRDGDGEVSDEEWRLVHESIGELRPADGGRGKRQGRKALPFDVNGDGREDSVEKEAGKFAVQELVRKSKLDPEPAEEADEGMSTGSGS